MSEVRSTPEDGSPSARRHPFLLAALLLALTGAVFAHVCRQPFVDWDDAIHTYQNPYLTPVTPNHLAHFWRHPYEGIYAPLSYMAFALLSSVGRFPRPVPAPALAMTDLNPHVFHTANLLLHLLNVLLVFGLLRRMVRNDAAAFGGALLFAVHPVQVEAVAWVSELRGLLGSVFSLLALDWYLDYAQMSLAGASVSRARGRYLLAFAAFLLALLAKPSAAAVPVMAWMLDWFFVGRSTRQSLTALGVWAAAILPIFWLTQGAQPVDAALHVPFGLRLLVAGDALAFYFSKLFLPLNLGIDYGRTPDFVRHDATAHLTWAVPLLLGVLVYRWRLRCAVLPAAFGLFLAALLPVLGLTPFYFQNFSTVADRYLYLALLGPALVAAMLLAQARGRTLPLAFGAASLAWVCLSIAQVRVWDSSLSLFAHAVAVNPGSAKMQYNLANTFQFGGNTPDAVMHYRAAIAIDPTYAEAQCNLGQALADSGHLQEGLLHVRAAERIAPRMAPTHEHMGTLLARAGDWYGAMREWQETLRLCPTDTLTRYNLGCVLFQKNRRAEARAEFETVLRLQPDYARARQALTLLNHANTS